MRNISQKTKDQENINMLWEHTKTFPGDMELRHKLWEEVRKYKSNYKEKFPFNYKHKTIEK